MPKHPLVEVFGYNVTDMSPEAARHRDGRLCPFHNSSGLQCTKNSKTDPLGVCTVSHKGAPAITCPVRFRQDMLIVADAARFFFPPNTRYVALTEVRLNDKNGKSAGNIDMVLVALDNKDRIVDFGALEVQAVYVSGNVKQPFEQYMSDPIAHANMEWPSLDYPQSDYVSSRKSLARQLIGKCGILSGWGKKVAIVVDRPFFEQMPSLPEAELSKADTAWMVYDLECNAARNRHSLAPYRTIYTKLADVFEGDLRRDWGDAGEFIEQLEAEVDNLTIVDE